MDQELSSKLVFFFSWHYNACLISLHWVDLVPRLTKINIHSLISSLVDNRMHVWCPCIGLTCSLDWPRLIFKASFLLPCILLEKLFTDDLALFATKNHLIHKVCGLPSLCLFLLCLILSKSTLTPRLVYSFPCLAARSAQYMWDIFRCA